MSLLHVHAEVTMFFVLFSLSRSLDPPLYRKGFTSPKGGLVVPESARNTNCINVGSIQTRPGMVIDKPLSPP